MKYGLELDVGDFISKADARCDQQTRLSPAKLADALNSEPALRVKDLANEKLLQISLAVTPVKSFRELQGYIRSRPGTACALATVAGEGQRGTQLVAVYREAYGKSNALVAKARLKAKSRLGPLQTFAAEAFQGAVIIDPVVVRLMKFEVEESRMLDLQVPAESAEYLEACCGGASTSSGASSELARSLASQTCASLAGLALCAAGACTDVAAASSCSLVLDLMGRHLVDRAVQAEGCRSLDRLLLACPREYDRECVIEAITAAMRRHTGDAEVQEVACAALSTCLREPRPELKSEAASQGSIEQVVGAMRQFPESATLQTWACGAIASLSAGHPMNQTAFAGARGIEAIAAAMETHLAVAQLQTMACGAFGNLAANHTNNQTAVAGSGGIELIIASMRQHAAEPSVQQAAIGALWCMAQKHPENQVLTARLGGTELIIAGVQRYPADGALKHVATGALQILVPGLGDALLGAQGPSKAWASPGSTPRVGAIGATSRGVRLPAGY